MRLRLPVLLVAMTLGLLYPVQRWIDSMTPSKAVDDEMLYFASGETIKKLSPGLDAIVADIYWIRTVQYFGGKLIDRDNPLSLDTKDIKMDLLAPLLNVTVTLDPHLIPAYRFGAIFLPERDFRAAVDLLNRGIEANPSEWRLYQDLGYVYWQNGDYAKAAEVYERGGKIEGAHWWMSDLAGVMRIRGGSREAAREVYLRYVDEDDPRVRNQAIARLKQIRSIDEREAINSALAWYKQRFGNCPTSLQTIAPGLRSMGLQLNEEGLPVDPEGFHYAYDLGQCRVELAAESTIPR